MNLKFIGRGACLNQKELSNSAFLIKDDTFILFDCGGDIAKEIMKKELLKNINSIYVFITHFHDDHIGSLPSFIFYCTYVLNVKPKIIFPHSEYLINFLAYQGCFKDRDYIAIDNISTCININEINISIYPIETTHYEYFKMEGNHLNLSTIQIINNDNNKHLYENYFKCYGYLISENNQNKIYYSGDSNKIPEKILEMFKSNKDLILYQDVANIKTDAHMQLSLLSETITLEDRKRVFCMHLQSDEDIKAIKENSFNVVETI